MKTRVRIGVLGIGLAICLMPACTPVGTSSLLQSHGQPSAGLAEAKPGSRRMLPDPVEVADTKEEHAMPTSAASARSPYSALPLPPPPEPGEMSEADSELEGNPAARPQPPVPPAPMLETKSTAGAQEQEPPLHRQDAPIVTALRQYLANRPGEAMATLSQYSAENQDLLLDLLQVAARMTDAEPAAQTPRETAFLIDQLERLTLPLRARAELVIDKICFCRRIDGYGMYEPMRGGCSFRPGEQVSIYVAIRNFSSAAAQTPDGDVVYTTRLSGAAEIRDETGTTVWKHAFQRDRPDQSRELRHDYFDHYRFCLPEQIHPGLYTLWIRVTDQPTGRTVQRSLDFHVRTAPALGS